MKQVSYKSLKIKNFMSIGDEEIDIKFKQGLNMITGQNIDNPDRKNAVGKSTLMNAFFWGVFGETIGKIANKNVINYITKKKGYVDVEFDIIENGTTKSYKIVRKLKPNSVELYEDGVDITRDSVRNTNAKICSIISSNAMISKCVDIMSISDNAPFMTQTAESKRKFISNIFNVVIFDIMKKLSKEDVKANNINKRVVDGKITTLESSLESLQDKKESVDEENATRKDKYLQMLDKFDKRIEKNEYSITEVESLLVTEETLDGYAVDRQSKKDFVDEWTEKISKLKDVRSKLEAKTEMLSNKLSKIDNIGGAKCSKCLQNIGEDHLEHLQEEKDSIVLEMHELSTKIDKATRGVQLYTKKVRDCLGEISKLDEKIQSNKTNDRMYERLKSDLLDLERQRYEFEQSFDDSSTDNAFVKLIEETEEKLTVVEEEFDGYRFKSDVLDVCNFVLGDEGVKSIVVKKLLTILNNNISKYLGMMGLDKRCEFDEYFDETIKSKGGVETSYYNCSGAERKTIDIACSLAFSDLRQRTCGVYSNVKFFDEIFDSAFDERGLDMFIEMLKEKITDSGWSVYAISHRKEAIKHIDGQVIELVKKNDVTSLK